MGVRILVIGAGATGGYFGARLADAGRDVTFLVREGRAEHLRRSGLEIVGPLGGFSVTPKLLLASELRASPQTFDLILLSTKAYSLASAMEDFAPAVGAQTAILPLLNGISHLDTLADRFGAEAVLGGYSRVSADLDAEGRIYVFKSFHDLVYGELDGRDTPRIAAIEAALSDAGFPAERSANIREGMWMKWVTLASFASTNCLMRGTIGAIAAVPGGADTARAIIAECAAIAAANGHVQSPESLEKTAAFLTKEGSPLTASMYRDLEKGAAVEVDHILGDLLARGAGHGIATPLLRAAFVQMKVYANGRVTS